MAPRRAKGTGTITRISPGVYRLRFQDTDGHRHSRRVRVENKVAAEKELRRFIDQVESEAPYQEIALGDLIRLQLDQAELSPTTRADYESVLRHAPRRYLLIPAHEHTPAGIASMYRSAAKRLSPHRMARLASLVSRGFAYGLANGYITSNPAVGIRPKAPRARELSIPSDDLIRDVVKALDGWVAVAVRLLAATGMRRGEAIALRWIDIDFTRSCLTVRQAAVAAGGERVVQRTKTASSVRTIALDQGTLAMLRTWREQTPGEWVFPSDDPRLPARPDSLSQGVQRALAKAGISGFTLRDLRHASVTRLLLAGIDIRTVAGRHGHARTSTTLDRYAAYMPAADRAAAEVVEGLF